MKTIMYIPTLLALLIHVMVSGQSLENLSRKVTTEAAKDSSKEVVADYSRLVKAANYYDKHSRTIKDASYGRQSKETELMVLESDDLSQTALIKQTEASELAAKLNYKAYEQNSKIIAILFAGHIKDVDSKDQAVNLISDAARAMNTAKHLRVEARALENIAARLGYMGNAEEKEFIALSKQEKAIGVLEKASWAAILQMESSLAIK
jgi:hypothetical protein